MLGLRCGSRAHAIVSFCMKLLFDQNISPRAAKILGRDFPGSAHVLELGLDEKPDLELWEYAKENDFCIVSKDSDFGDWAQIFGCPPTLVWLRVGNCSTRDLIAKMRAHAVLIHRLGKENEHSVLVIM